MLTEIVKACIIHQVAASEGRRKAPSEQRLILENDTESRRTRTVIYTNHGKRKDSQFEMSFEPEGDFRIRYRI